MTRLVAIALVTFAAGLAAAVLVAGSASATSPPTSTKATTTTSTSDSTSTLDAGSDPNSPGARFFVINGTVSAASDHEIVGSSAFPNYSTGAVDNYYSLAKSHVDNSPFAEGTASPFDTGPIGQTAAAGNTQQPQYADARWPGDSGKAEYGNEGGPHAVADASEYHATADASEATNPLSGPAAPKLALPKGFDFRLQQALAGWKAKWQGPLGLKKPATPTIKTPTLPVKPPAVPPVTTPGVPVKPPTVSVPGVKAQPPVSVPAPPAPSQPAPAPPLPTPTVPTVPSAKAAPRSLASRQFAADSTPTDGESLLTSSSSATLVPVDTPAKPAAAQSGTSRTGTKTTGKKKTTGRKKTAKPVQNYALVTKGESSLGRVSLGGGQIVIEGIHVTASITNDGTPTYKAAVSVASASIGGIPVTIDQDGVHVAGQGGAVPYQQASDALNNALKQAGIQLFLVGPEVTKGGSCGQTGGSAGGGGTGTTPSPTTPAPTSGNGQSSGGGGCDQPAMNSGSCGPSGTSTGTPTTAGPPLPAPPTSTGQSDTTTTPSSCDQPCDQSGTTTGTTTTTTTTTAKSATTTTSSAPSGTSTGGSSCGGTGMSTSTSSCLQPGSPTGTTPSSTNQSATTTSASGLPVPTGTTSGSGSGDQTSGGTFDLGGGASNAAEETVTATGVHVVFTQPVNQSGVPAQNIEHILGEVYVDSLATPAGPAGPVGSLGFSSSPSGSSSACGGSGNAGGASGSGASMSGGGSAVGGSSGSPASSAGSAFGSGSQPTGGSSTGTSLPAAFAAALRKPLWLLLAYLLWQALVIGTGVSVWNWRRDGTP